MVVVKKDSMRKGSSELKMPAPPDGGWGWVVVFASFMIHVIADGVTYTFGIFYVEFLEYYKESKGTTAWVASIMVGTTYCIGPVASGLTNKYGCRAVTIAGAILAAIGLMLSTLSPNVLFLFFSIGICTGAGFGLMYLPSIVSVTCYFEKKRAFATGIAVCGSGMGTFVLAPLTEHLVDAYGWKGAMLIIAGLVLNCAVFGGLFRPLEESPSSSSPPKTPSIAKKPDLPKLKINNGSLSNGRIHGADESSASPCTPLMFQANCNAIMEESPKKQDMVASDSKLSNGFVSGSKQDISSRVLPPGYCTNPSTPSEVVMNGFGKDVALRSNGYSVDRREDNSFRNSLMLPSEFLKRKVEGSPLSSFVCSSASLAQTNKELESVCHHPHHSSGLLYRKDIFYSGSLVSLAKYRSNPNISYSAVPVDDARDGASKKGRFRCCPTEIRDALAEMTDFSLLMNPIFLMFAISNFLTSIGFNVPYVYTKDRVADMKIASDEDASYLLSVIGISNTIGRVTLGYLSDRACVNRLWIYNVSLIICGLATALSCYAANYTLMAAYCATFGATAGAYVSLTSVILVDLLGLDKLTNAFGILLVFEGVSCLLGPPITALSWAEYNNDVKDAKDVKTDRYELYPACMTLLRTQVNMEMHASLVYMNMAAHFDQNGIARKGFSKLFRENSKEEREHAQKLIDYLNLRGSKFGQFNIDMPEKTTWNSALEALNDAIVLEKEVYNQLNHIHDVADTHCKDSHLMDFLEREYFAEQVESIDGFIRHSSILGNMADEGLAEYLYDLQLQKEQGE